MKKKVNEIAKSLLVKADKDYYVVVLPADNNLNLDKVGKIIKKETGKNIKSVKIPGEKIMQTVFKIKAGTMSAFGKIYKLPVIVDVNLVKVKKAVFSSGSYNHSIEVLTKDFIKVEEAILGSFGVKKKIKKQVIVKKNVLKKKTTKKSVTKKPAKNVLKKSPAKKTNKKIVPKKKIVKKTVVKKKK
jgi:prolyl-tRNA editing enzyme YbaK/EbsC (Cys-tRNA(Pro) deacylase)